MRRFSDYARTFSVGVYYNDWRKLNQQDNYLPPILVFLGSQTVQIERASGVAICVASNVQQTHYAQRRNVELEAMMLLNAHRLRGGKEKHKRRSRGSHPQPPSKTNDHD